MRSFSLVLLRRLLFRSTPSTQSSSRLTLYDQLSNQTLLALEGLLLHSLEHETVLKVRNDAADTICDVANQGMSRGRPWHALQSLLFNLSQTQNPEKPILSTAMRVSAFRIIAGSPNLVMDLQVDLVVDLFQRGLQDQQSTRARLRHTPFSTFQSLTVIMILGSPWRNASSCRIPRRGRSQPTSSSQSPHHTNARNPTLPLQQPIPSSPRSRSIGPRRHLQRQIPNDIPLRPDAALRHPPTPFRTPSPISPPFLTHHNPRTRRLHRNPHSTPTIPISQRGPEIGLRVSDAWGTAIDTGSVIRVGGG